MAGAAGKDEVLMALIINGSEETALSFPRSIVFCDWIHWTLSGIK
jgi:hypothetical protein